MMVLIIGYVLLALLVTTAVMAASSLYLEHKKLLSAADGASVAAADSYTLGQVETEAAAPPRVLNGARVRSVAADYLHPKRRLMPGSTASPSRRPPDSPDGSTAVVVLTAAVHPPVVNFLIPDGIRIEATSTARSRLVR